jgi:hypothetical protein
MGIKATIIATPPTAAHQVAALKVGVNAAGLIAALKEQITETLFLLGEIIKGIPSGNLTCAGPISTASATILMAAPVPSWVIPGMVISDLTNAKAVGTVLSAAASTITLTSNAANAGSGSSDVLQISDPNLSVYQGLVTSLS